jgi:acyl transferase domain-containing protein
METTNDPIAIIGIGTWLASALNTVLTFYLGCRFPGAVTSPSELWDLLIEGRSGHSPSVPLSRFNSEGFYHPDRDRPGSINSTGGYFLDGDPRDFENALFGINNLEATYMDPQQRKLLEVVFESFEDAGYALEKLQGSNVGCYVANFTADYLQMQVSIEDFSFSTSSPRPPVHCKTGGTPF